MVFFFLKPKNKTCNLTKNGYSKEKVQDEKQIVTKKKKKEEPKGVKILTFFKQISTKENVRFRDKQKVVYEFKTGTHSCMRVTIENQEITPLLPSVLKFDCKICWVSLLKS